MTNTPSGLDGADGEATSASSGRSPLARFRSRPMPAAGKAESTQAEEEILQTPQLPFSSTRKTGQKKGNKGSSRTIPSPNAGRRQDLADRLIRFARPLALKYQLNLAQTFGTNEAEEWVRASESALMRLPLRNVSAEAAGFYAELALALADERQKERGILAEPALKLAGGTSLLVDLKGKK